MQCVAQDGIGGLMSALSFCDIYAAWFPTDTIVLNCITSESSFKVINYFAPDFIKLKHHPDNCDDLILCDQLAQGPTFSGDRVFNLTPDRFGRAVGYETERCGISWQIIKENRVLLKKYQKPRGHNVFLALVTAQDGNSYPYSKELINGLCAAFPGYSFYFCNVKHWGGKKIDLGFNPEEIKHTNFICYTSDDIVGDFRFLAQDMAYFICVDSGVANFAYHLGRPRILLDSRFNNLAFKVRWRQNESDLIPINTLPAEVIKLFDLSINNSELDGILKRYIISYPEQSLHDALIYKQGQKFKHANT